LIESDVPRIRRCASGPCSMHWCFGGGVHAPRFGIISGSFCVETGRRDKLPTHQNPSICSENPDAGGGNRTSDTRLMIGALPLILAVNQAVVGPRVGLVGVGFAESGTRFGTRFERSRKHVGRAPATDRRRPCPAASASTFGSRELVTAVMRATRITYACGAGATSVRSSLCCG